MPRAASDDGDVQHAPGQVTLALHESTVHNGNHPERRVEVSDLRLELSSLVKVPCIHVLRVPKETATSDEGRLRAFDSKPGAQAPSLRQPYTRSHDNALKTENST